MVSGFQGTCKGQRISKARSLRYPSHVSRSEHTMPSQTRRTFLTTAAATTLTLPHLLRAQAAQSLFHVGVISDEISPDFDHACHVIANDFGLHYVELRALWGKNLQASSDAEIAEAQRLLKKYSLQVTDIASPLFKTDWPGAPKSTYSAAGDLHGAAETTFQQQADILTRSISLARQFGTDKVRCFDFWRIDDPAPFRQAIDDHLRAAAETAGRQGILLVLENEFECNTATGREAARTLAAIPTPHLALNWDPANAVMRGELDAFPAAWALLPKDRIHHCHVKNARKNAAGKIEWSPVGEGYIDWSAQFRALAQTGYHNAVTLETHWTGGGSPEASSRTSWAGMHKALETA